MFFNDNRNRLISILLILMVVFTCFAGATVSASAFAPVLTAPVIACVGAVLVACGFTFNNSDEMSAVVQKVWDYVPDSVKSALVTYGQKYLENMTSGKPFILTLTSDIVSSLTEWFVSDVVENKVSVDYGGFPSNFSISESDIDFLGYDDFPIENLFNRGTLIGSIGGYPLRLASMRFGDYTLMFVFVSEFFKVYYSSFTGFGDNTWRYTNALQQGVFAFGYSGFRDFTGFGSPFTATFSIDLSKFSESEIGSYYMGSYGPYPLYSVFSGFCSPVYKFIYEGDFGLGVSADVTNNSDYAPTSTTENALTSATQVYVPNSVYSDGALSSAGVESMTTAGVRDVAGAETSSQTGLLSIIWELLKSILDAITSGFSSVLEWLKSMLDSLVSAITGVATAVVEGVKALFYPTDFAWSDFIGEVQALAPSTNVDFRSYTAEIEIPDVTMTSKWGTQTIVDNSPIRDNIETIRKYLGAFLTALLVIFNANMVMKFLGMTSFSLTDSRVNHEMVDNSPKGLAQQAKRKGGK